MSSLSAVVLSLCLLQASSAFTNVTHLATSTLAFGSANSDDGTAAIFPAASSGGSVGAYETFDSGANMEFEAGVGQTAGAIILMAAGSRGNGQNMSVILAGLVGSAISQDGGHTWDKLNIPEMTSQDVKYEKASDLYHLTGISLGEASLAVSSDDGNTFNMIPVTGLVKPDVRYSSVPSANTMYVTAGMWPSTSEVEEGTNRISAFLSVNKQGELIQKPIRDDNTTGYWAQVAKTTDGGATWNIVFEDFSSQLYPNDISCYDENTCTFVLEGGVEPRIMTTTDGGANWNTFTDESGGNSLMAVRMTGPTEAFVAGGGDVGRMWHTTDLVNWDASTTPVNDAAALFSFSLSADNSISYATGILKSQVCSMLKLEM